MASTDAAPENLWASLPKDLLEIIAERLTRLERKQFRSVRTSWRSSAAIPPTMTALLDSEQVSYPDVKSYSPIPIDALPKKGKSFSAAIEYRMYYVEPDASLGHNGFIASIELRREGIAERSTKAQKSLTADQIFDFFEFHMFELHLWYGVMICVQDRNKKIVNTIQMRVVPSVKDVKDVGLRPCDVSLMAIHFGTLVHSRLGDKKWSVINKVDDDAYYYVDVIYWKGKYYAVDDNCNIAIVDPTNVSVEALMWPVQAMHLQEVKVLVESNGKLYLVVDRQLCTSGELFGKGYISEVKDDVRIKIYRLDDASRKWKRVRSLGDRVFFQERQGSFAVSSKEFHALGRNRVYFCGEDCLCVFDVETGYWGQLPSIHSKGAVSSLLPMG